MVEALGIGVGDEHAVGVEVPHRVVGAGGFPTAGVFGAEKENLFVTGGGFHGFQDGAFDRCVIGPDAAAEKGCRLDFCFRCRVSLGPTDAVGRAVHPDVIAFGHIHEGFAVVGENVGVAFVGTVD